MYLDEPAAEQTLENLQLTADGQRAQVDVTARISVNFLNILTRQCISHIHDHDARTTVYLQHTGRDWMIYETRQISAPPQPTFCH